MTNPSFESEQAYNHLDDTGMFDAATIREMTGFETDGDNEAFSARNIAERTGSVALAGYAEAAPEDDDIVPQSSPEREQWVASFNLTSPSAEGPIQRATPEQRQETTARTEELKNFIKPTRFGSLKD